MTDARTASRRWLAWLPAIAVMAIIFVLSSQSGLRVSDDAAVDRPFRVTGHLLAFGTLAACVLLGLAWDRRPRPRDAAIALGVTFIFALSDEWHQSFVPERMGRMDDVVTDMIGAAVGLAVAWVALTWRARGRESGEDAA